MTIIFEILILYKDESSLKKYLDQFQFGRKEDFKVRKAPYSIEIDSDHLSIRCIRDISPYIRGYHAHFIAVQEEITWRDDWEEIRDCVLRPYLRSPIDIQIFDGDL